MEKDFNILRNLYEIHSPSGNEKKMRKYIASKCRQFGAEVSRDVAGNLYVTKGNSSSYPCVCAHMDQVQYAHSKDFRVIRCGDVILGFSERSREQQGLGADDKNGIWIALHLIRELPVIKAAFFVKEEVGCVGSSQADMDFFSDVRFVIEPDRRNGGDLITEIDGIMCSDEFLNDIDFESYGYAETDGLMTDVLSLAEKGIGVSCVNISCGYYSPHTDHETTSWKELCNALDFAEHICVKCENVYAFNYEPYYPKYRNWYGSCTIIPRKKGEKSSDEEYMEMVVAEEPYLDFNEVVEYYGHLFTCMDEEKLKKMWIEASGKYFEKYHASLIGEEYEDATTPPAKRIAM